MPLAANSVSAVETLRRMPRAPRRHRLTIILVRSSTHSFNLVVSFIQERGVKGRSLVPEKHGTLLCIFGAIQAFEKSKAL
jgi:hypothetical protein